MTATLSEAESRRIVARHGVTVSPFVTATDCDRAVASVSTSADVAFPVAVKLCGRSIAHKTERGLVRLGVADTEELKAACEELLGAATDDDGAVELLISSMIHGSRELIAGVTRDPRFGLVVMLGVGGVFAEAIRDVAFRLVPIERVDAEDLIDDLTSQRLLGEVRGEAPVDRKALVDTLLALSAVAESVEGVAGIDLNPIVIDAGRPVAVDALIELEDAGSAP